MLTRLLQFINEQHSTAFAPHGRYPTGEQGAFTISEVDGDRAPRLVLKWWPGTEIPDNLWQAAAITTRLRAVGYPAPRYRLLGVAPPLQVVYSIQEELPGTPLGGRLDRPLLDRLLELNALQREQAIAPCGTWPRPVSDPSCTVETASVCSTRYDPTQRQPQRCWMLFNGWSLPGSVNGRRPTMSSTLTSRTPTSWLTEMRSAGWSIGRAAAAVTAHSIWPRYFSMRAWARM